MCPLKKHDRSHYAHLDSVDDETLARLVRDFRAELFPYFQPPYSIPIEPADGPSIDAFGRFRVSQPTGIFDSQNQYDVSPILWESVITDNSGSAAVAHLPNESSVSLTVGASDTIVRQTRQYHRYQPGKSQMIFCTYAPAPAANVTQRIGYFDAQNGIFFEIASGGVCNIVKRSFVSGGVIETRVAQADWNENPLNGTGSDPHTLDFTKAQILAIDLEWLGVGRVRIGFSHGGIIHQAHTFTHHNALTSVYMTTANLPLRYEIVAGAGLVGTVTMRQICSQISSEGGVELERGNLFGVGRGASTVGVTVRRPILSIRPALTLNSIANRILNIIEEVSVFSASITAYYELVYGGTLTGASFNAVNATYSGMEFDVAASAISGGITILADYISASVQSRGRSLREFATRYPIALSVAGTHPTTPLTDSLTVVATSTAGSTDMAAAFSWREVR